MMFGGNTKMAMASLRSTKWRSLLTMFGIIIGVASVIIIVSLGEGIKRQVVGQINRLGNDLITVRPGKIVDRDKNGNITRVNVVNGYSFTSGSLAQNDLEIIQKTPDVSQTLPISIVSGGAKSEGREYTGGHIIGTGSGMPSILRQKLAYGVFFSPQQNDNSVAIIGQHVAEQLFQENVPIGMAMTIHGQEFIVQGILDKVSGSPLPLGPDFNDAIFIPYNVARDITGGNSQLVQVIAKPSSPAKTKRVISSLNSRLYESHGQQNDFTVLKQDENLAVTSDILNLLTSFIAGIAAISLFVGGIGIMNIMFVSVTERTREIGIRKALGATNRQILTQFLIEASVLSFVGALFGVVLALLCGVVIRLLTNLQPVITWQVTLLSVAVAVCVGIIFGITPAAKAARKDPIDALRYE